MLYVDSKTLNFMTVRFQVNAKFRKIVFAENFEEGAIIHEY